MKKNGELKKMISEHERLVKVLRSPSPPKLKREAKIQSKELTEMKKK